MELTQSEKEILKLNENEFPYEQVLEGLLKTYTPKGGTKLFEAAHRYIKSLILKVLSNRGITVDENIGYNLDELLKEIITVEPNFVGFDPTFTKKQGYLDIYLNTLFDTMNAEEAEFALTEFSWMKDGIRIFFANYIAKLESELSNLYYEASNKQDTVDDWDSEASYEPEDQPVIIELDEEDTWREDWEELSSLPAEWQTTTEPVNETEQELEENNLTDEQLIELLKYVNIVGELKKCYQNCTNSYNTMATKVREKKLQEFYSDEEFTKDFTRIMDHDKSKRTFYFHGTQGLEDAYSIMEQGLGMMKEQLDTTTYKEFTMDEVILYQRGFGGEIGRYGIVIIDAPKNKEGREKNIVIPKPLGYNINFCPSGLQGLSGGANYVVLPEYIVGIVDKAHKKIIFNPKYYNYENLGITEEKSGPTI